MANQLSDAVRNAQADIWETTIGTAPNLYLRTGAPPANCAAADTGSLLATIVLPSDWMAAASGGSKSKSGTWSVAASGSGAFGHYRIKDNAGTTCHDQGTAGVAVPLTTNALTAANGNVLNFASTTGVAVGMNISGTGVPVGATVVALTGTTVTMSMTSTAGVANTTAITFAPDLVIDGASITAGQTVTVGTFTHSMANA
jgi:hypothetical protein